MGNYRAELENILRKHFTELHNEWAETFAKQLETVANEQNIGTARNEANPQTRNDEVEAMERVTTFLITISQAFTDLYDTVVNLFRQINQEWEKIHEKLPPNLKRALSSTLIPIPGTSATTLKEKKK